MKTAAFLLLLLAAPARAQFELQVVDANGARSAPAIYDLGSAYSGETLSARFRLRNPGSAPLSVAGIALAGVGFTLAAPKLPVTVDAQAALEFTANFRSTDLGSYSAVLRAENVTILLTAAVLPRLSFRSDAGLLGTVFDFGTGECGSTVRRTFLVLNETPQVLTIPAISLVGSDFAFVSTPPSGNTLIPQQSAAFAIDFTPTTSGARAAILVLGDRSVLLTGTAADPPPPRGTLSVDLKQPYSAQQGNLIIDFDQPARASGTGTVTLDFRGSADPTIAFASGGRSATFSFGPGDSRVRLPLQTGTTAGTLVFTLQLGNALDTLAVQIPTAPPALTGVQAQRQGTNVAIDVAGWDNTHSVSQLVFSFYDAIGTAVSPGAIQVNASAEFSRFYSESDTGGAFHLRAVFPVTGDAAQVSAFEVSLTDLIGTTRSSRTPIH